MGGKEIPPRRFFFGRCAKILAWGKDQPFFQHALQPPNLASVTYLSKNDFTANHRRHDYSHPLLLLWQGLSAPWCGGGIGKLTNNRSSPISGNDTFCYWRIAFLKGIHSAQLVTAETVLTRRGKQRCYGPTWLQEVLLQEDDYDTRGPDREASTVRVLFSWRFPHN